MILSFVFGFISGIAFGSFTSINFGLFIAFIFVIAIFFIYRFFVERENRLILTLVIFVMFGVFCGVGRMFLSDLYAKSQLDTFVGQKMEAEGIIVSEPDVRENNTRLTISLRKVFVGTTIDSTDLIQDVAVREKILVTVPIYPKFTYGDKVRVKVILSKPTEIETDGRVFDYGGYLRARGVWFVSRFTTISFISSGHGSIVKTFLFKTKNIFTDSINNALPQPESSLLAGFLLGTKQSLGKDLLTEFQKTGVSHTVVLSGYNIAIVASSIMAIFSFLFKTNSFVFAKTTFLGGIFSPKNLSFSFGALGIILFTILSGGGASASRAAIMVLVALFAKKMNRDYKVSRVFGFTVVLMLAPNPLLLAFDPSFQLSVLATIGLIFVSPYITPYLLWVTEKFSLREIVSSTIATQITVFPYLIYNMGILSVVSLPVNILILGTIPLSMFFGFITGIFGLVSLYLSFVPAFLTYILLWYQLTVVHIGASIPFGSINLPAFSPIVLVLVYVGIFMLMYFLRQNKKMRIR